jgi:exopolysaccharide biosynthesis protein
LNNIIIFIGAMTLNNNKFLSLLLIFCYLSLNQADDVVWNKPKDWNLGLPSSIQVFQTNSSFPAGIKMTAAYCLVDLADPNLELKVVHSEGHNLKTLPQYIAAESQDVYMIINGGYFNMITNLSQSLVISDSKVIAFSLNASYSNYNGHSIPYYPTPGAFGVYKNGTPEVGWTYSLNNNFSNVYRYPQPSPICNGCPPQMIPGKILPHGGKPWGIHQAIGAGPMLIINGKPNVTAEQEMKFFSDARNPRTAVCITKDRKVAFIVVDGRYSLSDGILLKELAELMSSLGCQDALNLDGGGSTAMIVNGYLTNRPADATGFRPVTSAVMIVKKAKTTESIEV